MSDFYSNVDDRVFADWNYGHAKVLYGFIRALKPQVVVEVGLYRAYCASWMAKALQENNTGKLFTIDNFSLQEHVERYGDPRAHAEANLDALGVRAWVEIIEGESDQVQWPEKVDFAYVDAFHSYNACRHDFMKAVGLGATFLAVDDTENCVGPRRFVDTAFEDNLLCEKSWQRLDLHSDNGLTIFMKKQPRRLVTFSQELPLPNPGVDLRPLTPEEQVEHFAEAKKHTGLDYTDIMAHTEHA